MCGLVVHIPSAGPVDEPRLKAMSRDIAHRGPDDDGLFVNDWVGLGHRRLAILDPTPAGHQPMFSACGRYIIVYNGEIYNFPELRTAVEGRGIRLRSRTDTEAILEAFALWGTQCVERLSGMFAFAIADLEARQVFLARDHLGIKPLYFCQGPFGFLAASEIKVFRHHIDFQLNRDVLGEQFLFRYAPGPDTIFRDVRRLDAGGTLTVSANGGSRTSRYYSVTQSLLDGRQEQPDADAAKQALRDAIGQHTQSDVGYNIQLSGGLDSSYIVAELVRQFGEHPKTFSVEVPPYDEDEGPYQRFVAETFGTDHEGLKVEGGDLADEYLRAAWHMDIPIIHTSCALLMRLCDISQSDSKVILTGEGADELFGGYTRYKLDFSKRLSFSLGSAAWLTHLLPPFGKLGTLRKALTRDHAIDSQILADADRVKECFAIPLTSSGYYESLAAPFSDYHSRLTAIDQSAYLSSMLERQDRMSMAASVESRVPFVVPALFDMVNRWKPSLKVHDDQPKAVFKEIAETYFAKDFVYRRKNGFVLPLDAWLRDRRGFGRFLDLLADDEFRSREYYHPAVVEGLVRDHLSARANHGKILIRLINFEIWHRIFIDRTLSAPA